MGSEDSEDPAAIFWPQVEKLLVDPQGASFPLSSSLGFYVIQTGDLSSHVIFWWLIMSYGVLVSLIGDTKESRLS